jgi:hypothetical protein
MSQQSVSLSRKRDKAMLRLAFQKPLYLMTKVTAEGFEIDDHHYAEITGRVMKATLVRKLFEDGFLSCSSSDGIHSADGVTCDDCQHPNCQPRLRVQLVARNLIYVLDLSHSSARNLFAIEDQAESEHKTLPDCLLKLSVVNRGFWGEVRFERIDVPRTDGETERPSGPVASAG